MKPTIKNKRTFKGMKFDLSQGESIEEKVRRIVEEKEPIKDGAPIIYTELKDGVKAEFNIRTDKWIVAIDAMEKVSNYEASKYLNGVNPNKEIEQKSEKKEEKESA